MTIFLCSLCLTLLAMSETFGADVSEPCEVNYTNPIQPPAETAWPDYGFGDPFVFRFNGRYYLYPSTRDDEIGVKCWSSTDLVHWIDEGLCSTDPLTKGAYAPEVVYWNGSFYMYTSPGGRGHYVLKADAPTGPFVPVSENIGLSIDGSVFIDDDGSWYFYHAFERGILGHRMTGPARIDPSPILVGASMNGWTEGPAVVKHDGIYYITYTGNHVISRGYRIDAGSGNSPLRFFPIRDNPILLRTDGALYGIGHSSTVKGPNLDTYYIVYHSLSGRGKQGWPVREMNIDRLIFNRDRLSVAGPTRTPQRVNLADWALWFDKPGDLRRLRSIFPFPPASEKIDGKSDRDSNAPRIENGRLELGPDRAVVSRHSFEGDFTAEYNLAFSANDRKAGEIGALFCYADSEHFGCAGVNRSTGRMTIAFVDGGRIQTDEAELPRSFGENISFDALESIQVERTGEIFSFYVNDRLVTECSSPLPSGAVGYYSKGAAASCGFLGATADTGGRSANRLAQPVPGTVSVCCLKTDNGTPPVERKTQAEGRLLVLSLSEGDRVSTDIDVADSGFYDITLRCAVSGAASLDVAFDDAGASAAFELPKTDEPERFVTEIRRRVPLAAGKQNLTLSCAKGNLLLSDLVIVRHNDVQGFDGDFASTADEFAYSDGGWKKEGNGLASDGNPPFGKRLYGENGWGDYAVEADVTFLDRSLNAGILIRTQNPALGGPNNSPVLGTDFFQGYFIGFAPGALKLSKHNYNWVPLVEAPSSFKPDEPIHLRVEASGAKITVSIDGKTCLEFTDDDPFFQGRAGIRACGASVKFENFRVTPLDPPKTDF